MQHTKTLLIIRTKFVQYTHTLLIIRTKFMQHTQTLLIIRTKFMKHTQTLLIIRTKFMQHTQTLLIIRTKFMQHTQTLLIIRTTFIQFTRTLTTATMLTRRLTSPIAQLVVLLTMSCSAQYLSQTYGNPGETQVNYYQGFQPTQMMVMQVSTTVNECVCLFLLVLHTANRRFHCLSFPSPPPSPPPPPPFLLGLLTGTN